MKVFKFGGASVKDASAVKNIASILRNYAPKQLVVVVSAMGKTTNALEKVLHAWFNNDENLQQLLNDVITYHQQVIADLFPDKNHLVYFKTDLLFGELEGHLCTPPTPNFDFEYDQVVSFGELISTTIVSEYLVSQGFNCQWFDVRNLIRTDDTWRDAGVDWVVTTEQVTKALTPFLNSNSPETHIALTQGFIGATGSGHTTTLGREGSDYSAAILSHVLNATEMTVWKDVPGVLNADPKFFQNTTLINHISYREAIELTYYGASVIHPKTIKPLQNKSIPLKVRSFVSPASPGTTISAATSEDDAIPSIILKSNQVLLSFSPRDFSFIAEENLSQIFSALAASGIRVNMMQVSAISFSICMDENERKMEKLTALLGEKFAYRYNTGLQLITVRHYDQLTISRLLDGRQLIVEQRSRSTAQFAVLEKS
ncbi:MAG TPA: aspartate kinase [Bacteroidales bacterium]|nr:aspartate kinase [Bacteroidales bacterium]